VSVKKRIGWTLLTATLCVNASVSWSADSACVISFTGTKENAKARAISFIADKLDSLNINYTAARGYRLRPGGFPKGSEDEYIVAISGMKQNDCNDLSVKNILYKLPYSAKLLTPPEFKKTFDKTLKKYNNGCSFTQRTNRSLELKPMQGTSNTYYLVNPLQYCKGIEKEPGDYSFKAITKSHMKQK
jgi:hypothetical protein